MTNQERILHSSFVIRHSSLRKGKMREWKQIQGVLAGLGLGWSDVWRLTIDRRAKTVVVVATDGRKFTAKLGGEA